MIIFLILTNDHLVYLILVPGRGVWYPARTITCTCIYITNVLAKREHNNKYIKAFFDQRLNVPPNSVFT